MGKKNRGSPPSVTPAGASSARTPLTIAIVAVVAVLAAVASQHLFFPASVSIEAGPRPPAADHHANVAFDHWTTQEASDAGVLAGEATRAVTHDIEVAASLKFLRQHLPGTDESRRALGLTALDCGAGVGRVSKNVLGPIGVGTVDLVEPQAHMVAAARTNLGESGPRLRHAFLRSLELFGMDESEPGEQYDVIVVQWVMQYLRNNETLHSLKRLRRMLRRPPTDGFPPVLFWKENYSGNDKSYPRSGDGSYTRSDREHRQIFREAGWKVLVYEDQSPWAKGYVPVRMYLLVPRE